MAGERRRLSLWLEPAVPDALERWIADAAERCGVPALVRQVPAHLTLGGSSGMPQPEVAAGAARIAGRLQPVEFVRAGFASFSGDPHRVLVVLAEAEALNPAFDLLRSELPQAEPSEPPHLSLAYGQVDPTRCLAMLREVYAPDEPMPERFVLSRLTLHDTSADDHTAWRRLGEWPLSG